MTPRGVPDAQARRRAAIVAGHTGDAQAARAALADADTSVRTAALGALDRLGVLQAVEVAGALRDPEAAVRIRAAELVPLLDGRAVEGARGLSLLPLLDDQDAMVVETAAFACGERVPPEPGSVTALCDVARKHTEPLCREAAVAALGAIGDDEGLAAILEATHDKPAVRRRAVLALAPFDGPEVQAALEAALTDRDWQVRQAAEDLLAIDPSEA